MRIETFKVGKISTNCYLVCNDETNELIVIDPGGINDLIFEHVSNNNYNPVAILLTHGHFDHILGVPKWLEKYPNLTVYADEHEKDLLLDPDVNLSHNRRSEGIILENVNFLTNNQLLKLAGLSIKCLWTPGHTIGGMSYYIESENVLFSGDTLFYHTVGRSDFPTGDSEALINSIKTQIMTLPSETTVLPGHDRATTIGDESKYNQYAYQFRD